MTMLSPQISTNTAAKSTRTRLLAGIAAVATLLTAFAAGSATYADTATAETQAPTESTQNGNNITPPPATLAR